VSIRRDYKPAATRQQRQRARRNGLLVMTLILIGLFGGLLAYIKGDRTQTAPAAAVVPGATVQPAPVPAAPPPKAMAVPTPEPAPIKPKYDFYTELPKRQIGVQSETAKPKNAAPLLPGRPQPMADPPRKPAVPVKNRTSTTPTMAAANSARPNVKPGAEPATVRTANARPNVKPGAEPATVRTANARPNVKPGAEPATVRTANARPMPTANPARPAAQPIRSSTNESSKILVKTE
jgi:hypothetical protein